MIWSRRSESSHHLSNFDDPLVLSEETIAAGEIDVIDRLGFAISDSPVDKSAVDNSAVYKRKHAAEDLQFSGENKQVKQ